MYGDSLGGRGSLGPDTLAYELKYVCAGVTTYKVKGVVAVHQAPARTAATINTDAFVTDTIVVAVVPVKQITSTLEEEDGGFIDYLG